MFLRKKGLVLASLLALTAVFLFGSALQARAPVVGQVALTQATTLDGQPVTAQTTVFSGDTLAVGEGVAVLIVGTGSQIRLGSDTVASFVKEGDSITVHLEKGIVSISSSKDGIIKVTAAGVVISPAGGFKTIAHIAMLGAAPGSLSVTAREGSLEITQPGSSPVTVTSGSTITVRTQAAAGAPAPQGGAGGSSSTLAALGVALSGGALVTSGVAASKAGDDDATAAANSATTAANTAATNAAAAQTSADAVGADLDQLITNICDIDLLTAGAKSCPPPPLT